MPKIAGRALILCVGALFSSVALAQNDSTPSAESWFALQDAVHTLACSDLGYIEMSDADRYVKATMIVLMRMNVDVTNLAKDSYSIYRLRIIEHTKNPIDSQKACIAKDLELKAAARKLAPK